MQRYVFYAEAKCRAGIKNVKRETKDVVSVTKSGSSPRFGFNPNRSLARLMYNFNNCLQSFAFYKASFACF